MNPLIPTVLAADPSAHVWDDKVTILLDAAGAPAA